MGLDQQLRVGDVVASLRAGVSPVCDPLPPGADDFGVLTLTAVTSGIVDRRYAKRIAASRVKQHWPTVKAGTILITRGSGSRDLVGACVLVESDAPRLILPDTVWVLELREGRLARFLIEFLQSPCGRKAIHKITRGSNGIWKISQGAFLAVPLPPTAPDLVASVSRISELFGQTSQKLTSLLEAKREFKRGVMQALLSGTRRFPEFERFPWRGCQFGQLCEELTARNGNVYGPDRVMGVVKGVGFERMRERVRGKGDLTKYKLVPPGAFAYNPMRLNIGSIAYNDLDTTVLVSPDYVVFRPRPGIAEASYVNQLRRSNYWSSFMDRAGAGSVRVRIYFSDLVRLRVPAPACDEQLRIAQVLTLIDHEIAQLGRLQEVMRAQKRGLLSRLLDDESAVPT
jgi:type I restriction enzyme S subunit